MTASWASPLVVVGLRVFAPVKGVMDDMPTVTSVRRDVLDSRAARAVVTFYVVVDEVVERVGMDGLAHEGSHSVSLPCHDGSCSTFAK
jgi:hypothetical protein